MDGILVVRSTLDGSLPNCDEITSNQPRMVQGLVSNVDIASSSSEGVHGVLPGKSSQQTNQLPGHAADDTRRDRLAVVEHRQVNRHDDHGHGVPY